MSSWSYYNEIDEYAAAWLRNLIRAGHIAPGEVDTRSIEDVHPEDLRGFAQCHFFAGIGIWSLALRKAGWPDSRPVWTGSCPCQPFSSAGAGAGFDDERHLWPHFHWLIQECRPAVVFGEQVASRDADPWIDLVQDDLEGLEYGVAAVPFPSAGVGAPHIRDRLYWMANSERRQPAESARQRDRSGAPHRPRAPSWTPGRGSLPDPDRRMEHAGQHDDAGQGQATSARQPQADRSSNQLGGPGLPSGRLGDANSERARGDGGAVCGAINGEDRQRDTHHADASGAVVSAGPGPTNGRWAAADWLLCRDGKWRPVEPGTFPLVDGAPSRVGRLRAYGNAINAVQAETFIRCVMPSLS